MYQNCCKKCGSTDLFTKEKGNNVGLYCSDCGAWIKWLHKDELRAFEHSMGKSTKEERESVNNYIGNISKLTGANFFDKNEKMTEAEVRYYQKMYGVYYPSVPPLSTKCPLNYNLAECSSKEYRYECRSCENYNPLRMLYEKEKNGVKLGVPMEVILDDARIQLSKEKYK